MSIGRSVYDRLKRAAKGKDFEVVKRRWAYERFLSRIAVRAPQDGWVLKGGVLMLALEQSSSRATQDLDLSIRRGSPSGIGAVLDALDEACRARPYEADAMEFRVERASAKLIREAADHPTVRVNIDSVLRCGGAGYKDMPVRFMIDATQAELDHEAVPQSLKPTVSGFRTLVVPGYPWELVAAEKLHAVLTGTIANPRLRDYMDLLVLLRSGETDATVLAGELARVFAVRRDCLDPDDPVGLSDAFARRRQQDWAGTLRRTGYGGVLPASFLEAMDELRAWAVPLVRDAVAAPEPARP